MTYTDKMDRLRELGDLQAEMAGKAALYAAKDIPDLAMRFQRASYAAVNARTLMQAALMAERENPDRVQAILVDPMSAAGVR